MSTFRNEQARGAVAGATDGPVAGLGVRDRPPALDPPAFDTGTLLRSAALGAATGSRSLAGITAVALTSTRGDRGVLASGLGSRAGTAVTGLLAVGELMVDKLPSAPSRVAPSGLLPRIILGASAAAAMARRDGRDVALPVVVGVVGALTTSLLGARLRAASAGRLGSDKPGAVAEDALAAFLGWWGARRR